MEKIIAQGAEAVLIHKNNELIKRRISKGYRHPELDRKIISRRTRSEAKLLEKAGKIIAIPKIISVSESEIKMSFINEKPLSDTLDKMKEKDALKICGIMGKEIAKLHNSDIIHGDLTTSNMIFKNKNVYFIDFGLGFHSERNEDKAVDLHLLRQAFESKHFTRWKEYYSKVIEGYKKESKKAPEIFEKLEIVESRGRYKGKHHDLR